MIICQVYLNASFMHQTNNKQLNWSWQNGEKQQLCTRCAIGRRQCSTHRSILKIAITATYSFVIALSFIYFIYFFSLPICWNSSVWRLLWLWLSFSLIVHNKWLFMVMNWCTSYDNIGNAYIFFLSMTFKWKKTKNSTRFEQ